MKIPFSLYFFLIITISLKSQSIDIDIKFIPSKIYDYFDNNQPNCIITDGTDVSKLAKMLGPETLVITDKEFKEHNLSHYNIICIGTEGTNDFISTLNFPYKYDGHTFTIGDTVIYLKGNNFMAVSSSPFCKSNALLHLGTIADGYNNMFFKDAQFVIYKNDSVIHKGKYFRYLTELTSSPSEKVYKPEFYPNTKLARFPAVEIFDNQADTTAFKVLSTTIDIKNIISEISNKKVVLLGENHYFKTINELVKNIVFEINREHHFPYLIIEKPYSHTFVINEFLSITDDSEASVYFFSELDKIVTCLEDSILFNDIRKWNRENSTKRIQILCTDIEHNYSTTIEEILIPKLNNAGVVYQRDSLKSVDYLRKLNSNLNKIKLLDQEIFPLIDNLTLTLLAYSKLEKGFRHFSKVRQEAILKKYEDTLYFGTIIKNSKFIVYGGSEHTGTRNKAYLSSESEGYYLEHINQYTRGLTYSIRLVAFSYIVNNSLLYKENLRFRPSGYKRMIDQFKQALVEENINFCDTVFIFNSYDSFTRQLIQVSSTLKFPFYFSSGDIIRFEKPDYISFQDMKQASFYKNHYLKFDKVIVVPTSEVVNSR